MSLFRITGKNTKKLPSTPAKLERHIQVLFERNLENILNVTFLVSEYATTQGGRIDTLGIDKDGTPVIIEYKRYQNENIINQGLSYLLWLQDHKAEFSALINKKNFIKVDWSYPRVICIAESYNKYDLDTAALLSEKYNIQLLKYQIYDKNILLVETETQQKGYKVTEISSSKRGKFALRHQKAKPVITNHLKKASKDIQRLFENLKERIMSLDESIVEEPKAKYIAYKLTTNFVDVVIQKSSLFLYINLPSGSLKDPKKLARDLVKPKKIGHWGNGDYGIKLTSDKNLDSVLKLIKQSYINNK